MINLLEVTSTRAAHILFFNCWFCLDDKLPSTFKACTGKSFPNEIHCCLRSVQTIVRVLIRLDMDPFLLYPRAPRSPTAVSPRIVTRHTSLCVLHHSSNTEY